MILNKLVLVNLKVTFKNQRNKMYCFYGSHEDAYFRPPIFPTANNQRVSDSVL